jgi:hypothetical protein
MNEFKIKKGLIVQGSGSTILDIQGSQGQLFSVTDQLSGSLFSVNDISGIPIMEVFSNNTVNLGTFNAEAIKVSGSFATMTGSLFGTASFATTATTASFVTGSNVFGPFGSNSVISASFAVSSSRAVSSSFASTASFVAGGLTGTGTTNYIPKFTGTSTLGNSLIFDDGTNVGIGTTSPQRELDINGALRVGGVIDFTNNFNNQIYITSVAGLSNLDFKINGTDRMRITGLGNVNIGGNYDSFTNTLQVTGNAAIGYTNAAPSNGLIVAGNVGIGTTNPTSRLQVRGSGTTSSTVALRVENNNASSSLIVLDNNTVGIGGTPTSTDILFITSSLTGQWGIRTTRGIADSESPVSYYFASGNAHNFSRAVIQSSGTFYFDGALPISASGYEVRNTGEILRINRLAAGITQAQNILTVSGSNVGINTAAPSQRLEVAGNILTSGQVQVPQSGIITFGTTWNTGTLSFNNGPTTALFIDVPNGRVRNNLGRYLTSATNVGVFGTFDNYDTLLATNNLERVRITTSGNVGIGNASPTDRLQVTGGGVTAQSLNAIGSPSIFTSTGGLILSYASSIGSIRAYTNSSGTGTAAINFITAGTERVRITDTGNVGINTAAPSQRLEVAGNILTSGQVQVPQSGIITFGTTWNTGTLSFNNGPTTALFIDVPNGRVRNNLGRYLTSATNVGVFGTFDNYDTLLATNNLERVRITTSGNVGIGTTSPSELLDVNGAFVTRGVRVNNLGSGGFIDYNNGEFRFVSQGPNATTAGTYSFTVRESDLGGSVNAMVIGNTGNVGIGTTSPTSRLQIQGSGTTSATSALNVTNSSGTSRLFVRDDGRVGVNTSTPNEAFEVQGNARVSGRIVIGDGSAGSPALNFVLDPDTGLFRPGNNILAFSTTGAERIRITATGEVGIGTTIPESNVPLTVNTNNNAFNSTVILQNSNTGTSALSQIQMRTQSSLSTPLNITKFNSDQSTTIINQATASLGLGTSGSVRLHIASDGNVGIDTTSPTSRLHVSSSNGSSIFRAGTPSFPNLLHVTGSSVQVTANGFTVNSTKLEVTTNVGIQTSALSWVHISSSPVDSKYLRIDAVQDKDFTTTYIPDSGNTVNEVIGNVTNGNVLGQPDYWMEIELNSTGNIVLIPCYTPSIK